MKTVFCFNIRPYSQIQNSVSSSINSASFTMHKLEEFYVFAFAFKWRKQKKPLSIKGAFSKKTVLFRRIRNSSVASALF